MADRLRIGLAQLRSTNEVAPNIEATSQIVRDAVADGAQLVATPEMTSLVERNPDKLRQRVRREADDEALAAFKELARELEIFLLIGSMPILLEDGKIANRSYLLDPTGLVTAYYDKVHLFDVRVGRGEEYRESDTYEPGARFVTAKTPWATLGVTVCYDLRFAYQYRAMAQAGATIMTVPSAFTKPTGEAHWHVLLRARAIETGSFVLAPAQTGKHDDGRRTYGHSLVVDPWGDVLLDAGEEVGAYVLDLDLDAVHRARSAIPSLTHDRMGTLA